MPHTRMVQEKCDLLNDAATILSSCLDYKLEATAKDEAQRQEVAAILTSVWGLKLLVYEALSY